MVRNKCWWDLLVVVKRGMSYNSKISMVALWTVRTVVSSEVLVGREDSRWAVPSLMDSCARLWYGDKAGQEPITTREAGLADVTQLIAVNVEEEDDEESPLWASSR